MSAIEFMPLGGSREVGANCYLLEIDGLRILLDSGLHPREEGWDALPAFSYLDRAPDALIVSHAHVDHVGSLPYFHKLFPSTMIFATVPTVQIMERMLHNSSSVMERLKEERGISEYPLYEHSDVVSAMRSTYGIEMNTEFGITADSPVRISFSPAGHVLGAACVRIWSPDHTVVYTGDICLSDQHLLRGCDMESIGHNVDTLIIESTYGANEDADKYRYAEEKEKFGEEIRKTIERGGSVLVPSFALGRAQEILNILTELREEGTIPDVPTYASGLGRAIYEIYMRFEDHLKPGAQMAPLSDFDSVGDVWVEKRVKDLLKTPSIFVATSGMMIENTPSAMIAQQLVKDPRNSIFFVGYCDSATTGHSVLTAQVGDRVVFERGGEPIAIELDSIQWFHFSAHAPRKNLMDVIEHVDAANLIFVHGDGDAVDWMWENCGNGSNRIVAAVGETVRLEAKES